jgi:hypothetical protein
MGRDAGDAAELLQEPVGVFGASELAGLSDLVAAYFLAAVAPGTPLAASARITMRGRIKIGRWLPFRAREVLNPGRGFIWQARAAGVVSGSDRFVAGTGASTWRLFGLVPLMRAAGPDASRSAAERAVAEAIWIPTSLLPRFGVEWSTLGEDRVRASCRIGQHPVHIDLGLSQSGSVRSIAFQRWGDPDATGTFGLHPFGGEFTDHDAFDGVTIPVKGRLGWHYDTDRWSDGEFFRYRITDLELVTDARG